MNSKNAPLVSVVIPTRDRASLLPRAVRSVQTQTIQDTEIVIVDDNSTDDTNDVVGRLDDSRIYYRALSGSDGNAAAARNLGIEFATGQFVAFLDSDDEWLPKKLEAQLDSVSKAGDGVSLVVCGRCSVSEDGHSVRKVTLPPIGGHLFEEILHLEWVPQTSTFLAPRVELNQCRFDEQLPALQDLDLALRLSRGGRIESVADVLVRVFEHTGPRIRGSAEPWVPWKMLIEKYGPELAQRRRALSRFHYRGFLGYYSKQRWSEARHEIWKSLQCDPWRPKAWLRLGHLTLLDLQQPTVADGQN